MVFLSALPTTFTKSGALATKQPLLAYLGRAVFKLGGDANILYVVVSGTKPMIPNRLEKGTTEYVRMGLKS